ncbi:MAG: bifunctional 4-hydroxy-2-oxoglutarate aldolase/2-dehydro-3-deoxy-phosphogluconate aldolase, partial [Clostridiales bacterium]|nr:bifunctional 4-hydroxy-2-oxoglutarate aldolase/2-dehydro-3-deoxy-phosphogluconate aldolase [Clostridiales bacterium]
MNDIIEKISKIGIVPVITIDRVEDAIPLANALCAGGLPCAEITFRTKAAPEAIRLITERFPDMCVGAGTVLNETQVNDAIKAGACFLVSPGLNPHTVTYCQQNNIAIIPGIENSSDIERAIELGLNVVKFFPAEQSGGLGKLKAMSAPYVNMKFMPTGGISENNLLSYLDHPPVIACGGSWMVPKDLIDGGKWDEIERLTRQAVHKMLGFELAHIGVNAEDEKDALQ